MAFFGGLGNALKKVGGIAAKPFTGNTQSGMMPSIGPSQGFQNQQGSPEYNDWMMGRPPVGIAPLQGEAKQRWNQSYRDWQSQMPAGGAGGNMSDQIWRQNNAPGSFNPWLRRHRQLNPGGGAVSEPVMGGIGPSQGMIDRTSQRQIPSGNRFGSY